MNKKNKKNGLQFIAVFSANTADTFFVRLTFAYGEKVLYFFASEKLLYILVQMRTVVHFVLPEVLGYEIENVASEPVHAEICPKIDDIATFLPNFRVFPVQIRLFLGKKQRNTQEATKKN